MYSCRFVYLPKGLLVRFRIKHLPTKWTCGYISVEFGRALNGKNDSHFKMVIKCSRCCNVYVDEYFTFVQNVVNHIYSLGISFCELDFTRFADVAITSDKFKLEVEKSSILKI